MADIGNSTVVSCLNGAGKCFPLEPCVSDADCFNGRWPCQQGVCFSNLQVFSQAYFSSFLIMSVLFFTFTVCPSLVIYGKVKSAKKNRQERDLDRMKYGNKNDQLRRSLVPAISFTPFDNPMFNGSQASFSSAPNQMGGRDDEFYTEKVRGGGLVNAAGMNWRQSVMMSEAPQMRADAMARQRQQQQFGGMSMGARASVMFQERVEPMMSRMGRAVSTMYTQRQLGTVFEASQGNSDGSSMPDLDKIYRHADLCADMVARDDGAKQMNINVRALQAERYEAVRLYRILACFLKLLELDTTALEKVKTRIAGPVTEVASAMNDAMRSNGTMEKQKSSLEQATMMSRQLVMALTAMEGPFGPFNGAENWRSDSAEMLALEEYVSDCAYLFDDPVDDVFSTEGSCTRCCRKTANTFGIPDSIRLHPVFYFFFHFVQISLIFSFFVGKCDMFNTQEFTALNITVKGLGSVPAHICLQGKTRTYFGIGEQYSSILGKGTQSDISIPLLYGIMHQLLFLFGTLPVPMARGFWRDVAYYVPFLKKVFPIDTAHFFHMFVGYMALTSLFLGATIWVIEMGLNNCLNGPFKGTCTAFDLRNVKNFFDPIENVVFLRITIVLLWSTLIPLMRWRGEPPFFLPQIIKKYWFEFCYISHVTVALATFILAQAARFTVFFPTIATWFLYILDSWRETAFMTFRSEVDMSRSFIHTDPSDHNKPITMTIRFNSPERHDLRGGVFRKSMWQGAGKWVYLKVPSISRIEWHPFSLASADGDDFVQLQIGIRPGQPKVGSGAADSWVLKENSYNGDKQWIQAGGESWTYKLAMEMKRSREIPVILRGPYGSTFSSIFDESTKGAIIIGAGTGLSAVESCLRAMLYRKRTGQYTPPHVWVMWQTRRVGDLLWMWDSLNQLLIEALNDGTIQKSKIWSPNKSQYLGFLGLTFFISRADQNQLDTLRGMPRAQNDVHNVHTWLTNRSRILQSSLSNEGTHIRKYVKHVRSFLNRTEGRNSNLAIGFCGPTPVAKIISDAASDYGKVEFSYATE